MKKFKYLIFLISLLFNKKKFISMTSSQNDNKESEFLDSLIEKLNKKEFIEFGFHPFEFNTINLMIKNYRGTLVDANYKNVLFMRILNFFHNYKVKLVHKYLDKKNILQLTNKKYDIFSIDIDGNDYWLTKEILENNINFELMIVEYNSSFLDKSISVPYDPYFDRHKKHSSGWYHGASLNAFIKLFGCSGYSLVKTTGGNNAFFVKRESLKKFNLNELTFNEAFEESKLRNSWSGINAKEQFEKIKNLEFIEV